MVLFASQLPAPAVSKNKLSVQLNLRGVPSVPITKSVLVPAFRKRKETMVAVRTYQVKVKKFKSTRKVTSRFAVEFQAPGDCKESVTLAHSLYNEELQNLMNLLGSI
jgi:hypothetical protein